MNEIFLSGMLRNRCDTFLNATTATSISRSHRHRGCCVSISVPHYQSLSCPHTHKGDGPVKGSWHKGASFERDPKQSFLGQWMKMPYLWEVAQMCIFSPSMWKGANKTLGSAHESSRQKRCYSLCSLSPDKSPFALFIKAFEQLHWCRWQVLLEGLLATRLWPGDCCPNTNATGHREQVRLLEQLL